MNAIKKILIQLFIIGSTVALVNSCNHKEQSDRVKTQDVLEGKIEGLNINNLLTSDLELVEGTEVVVKYWIN